MIDAVEMTRTSPNGAVLRWRFTINALAGGPVPFLIDWADTEHPAASAPRGLLLQGFEIEDPDPEPLTRTIRALGSDVAVERNASTALVAQIRGESGTKELR